MVELQLGPQKVTGKIVGHDRTTCWLREQGGRQHTLNISDVAGFNEIPGRFRAWTTSELRDHLRREFPDREIVDFHRYVVMAPSGRARSTAELFDSLYGQLKQWFDVRGVKVEAPEFPLTALMFETKAEFRTYCRSEGVILKDDVLGCFLPPSNRVAFYLTNDALAYDTILHEATHQIAFNIGLHSRLRRDPLWLLEGMATVFEVEEARNSRSVMPILFRVQQTQLAFFQQMADKRKKGWVSYLIGSDARFDEYSGMAYAEAWALTFYLMERRPAEFSKYLQSISRGTPFRVLSPDERVAQFSTAVTNDLKWLEVEIERFFAGDLASRTR